MVDLAVVEDMRCDDCSDDDDILGKAKQQNRYLIIKNSRCDHQSS
jgi:hypothetical protein